MKSEKQTHLGPVSPYDVGTFLRSDPRVQAQLKEIVQSIMEYPREERLTSVKDFMPRFAEQLKAFDAARDAMDASPIYQRERKRKIRSERKDKIRLANAKR
jgi:hypothetical protein